MRPIALSVENSMEKVKTAYPLNFYSVTFPEVIVYSTPRPWPLKKGTFDSNTAINLEVLGTCPQHKTIKFELQKTPSSEIGKFCMLFRTLTRNIDSCELAMKSRKKFKSQ